MNPMSIARVAIIKETNDEPLLARGRRMPRYMTIELRPPRANASGAVVYGLKASNRFMEYDVYNPMVTKDPYAKLGTFVVM
jgi:hypothetical protein